MTMLTLWRTRKLYSCKWKGCFFLPISLILGNSSIMTYCTVNLELIEPCSMQGVFERHVNINTYQSQGRCLVLSHSFRPATQHSSVQDIFSFQIKIMITPHSKFLHCCQIHLSGCPSQKRQGYLWHLHWLLMNQQQPINSKSKISHKHVCSLPPTPPPP